MITKCPKNILIADDDLFFRVRLSDILVEAGHKVKLAKDGREAVSEINAGKEPTDLMLLDLDMPDVNGFDVLELIKKNCLKFTFPVLVISGAYRAGNEITEKLKGLGASGFLPKDSSPEYTLFRVNRLLFPDKTLTPRNRVPVSINARFTIGDTARTGTILNISDNGAFLHSNSELLPGTILSIAFFLPGTEGHMEVKGIVRWSTGGASPNNIFSGSGIMFTSVSEKDRHAMERFVNSELEKDVLCNFIQ